MEDVAVIKRLMKKDVKMEKHNVRCNAKGLKVATFTWVCSFACLYVHLPAYSMV